MFLVPLDTFSKEEQFLCYTIYGQSNSYFNLLSDSCVSVNAHYIQRPISCPKGTQPLNVIDKIAVLTTDSLGQCTRIDVSLVGGECKAKIGSTLLDNRFNKNHTFNSITIQSFKNLTQIVVPNCMNGLVMEVHCEQINGVDMIRYQFQHGHVLPPTSHGLIGM